MSAERATISVITACYQHGHWLGEAGTSVLGAARRRVEWIVVNDGSTDRTHDVAATFGARYPGAVRYLETPRVGQARAREAGAAVAQGTLWVLLDADDRLEPGMLDRCADALEQTPEAAAAAGDVWLVAVDGKRRLRLLKQDVWPAWPSVVEQNPLGGIAGVMLRAAAVRKVGGLAVEGAPGVEDWDLWVRFARCGLPGVRVDGVLGCYRQAAGSYSRRAGDMLRARLDLFARCQRPDPRLAAFPASVPRCLDAVDFRRLCHGAVFFALGAAAVAPPDARDYPALLAACDGGAVDVAAAIEAFRRGLWHAAVLGASPHRVVVAPLLDAVAARLAGCMGASDLEALQQGLARTARGLCLMRLKQRIKTFRPSLQSVGATERSRLARGSPSSERLSLSSAYPLEGEAAPSRMGDAAAIPVCHPLSSSADLSVILCTHNPRPAYLARVVDGLRRQTLAPDQWELLIVDNASDPPVEGTADVRWHPRGRVVREDELGLTPARLRGIRESRGSVLVFVDDDSILAEDYLAVARDLFATSPSTLHPPPSTLSPPPGVAGGVVRAEFEVPPPAWAGPYLGYLAIRDMGPSERRLAPDTDWRHLPWGVGMCVRRDVAAAYAQRVGADDARRRLDRRGQALTGSGDLDLALTAYDIGLGALYTPRLRLTHLIPRERLTEDYFRRLLEGSAYSTATLQRLRGIRRKPAWLRRILRRLRRLPHARSGTWRIMCALERAIDRGEQRVLDDVRSVGHEPGR